MVDGGRPEKSISSGDPGGLSVEADCGRVRTELLRMG